MQTFGDRLQILMDDFHLNKSQFAARLGVNPSSVSFWISGKFNPSAQTIKQICDTFGCRREWLVDGILPKYDLDPVSAQIADRLGHAIKHKSTATDRLIRAVAAAADNEVAVAAAVAFLERVVAEYAAQLPAQPADSEDIPPGE